jgi:amino acid adenylation domain-containing protein
MQTIDEFLAHLRSLDVKLWADGERLRYSAPEGTMTSTLLEQLRERKAEILAFLCQAAAATHSPSQSIQPVPRDGNLPLSFAQHRLWFLEQLEGESAAYNESVALCLTGPLNVRALEQSLREIVRRHEILRTTFPMINGVPIQVIAPVSDERNITMPVMDLWQLPEVEQSAEVQRLATEEARRPFDLANGPLLRVTLLKLDVSPGSAGFQEHVLLVTMHHIICDGWSTGIFVREIAALYEAFLQGLPSPLPELPIQYADFAHWQRQWLTGPSTVLRTSGVLETQLNYWKQQLVGAPPLLELPTDRPRPPVQTFRGSTECFEVNPDLTYKLKMLSRQEGVTLFMILLAVFKTLLYRYTEQADIVIGSPIANRNQFEIEGLIGFFVNTLALRTSLQGNPAFSELLQRVQQTALGAYEHQDVPFERLVEALELERNLSHAPLFQVMFGLQQAQVEKLALPGLTISPLKIERGTAKFDLTLAMMETAQGLSGEWEYNTDLFDAATIRRMMGHFLTLLEAIATNPRQRISELPLLTEAERHQILVEWNNTVADYPKDKCIHELFEAQVERTPDAVTVVVNDSQSASRLTPHASRLTHHVSRITHQLTYRELNARANQLAHYLRKLGVGPEILVGICVERSLEMIVGLLGILKAGGAYVPLDPAYPKERLTFMLEDSQVSVLLTIQKLSTKFSEHQGYVICLDTDRESFSQESKENPYSGVTWENLAYIIYTSGSTGKPKGVLVTHRGIPNLCEVQMRIFDVKPDSRVLQFASFSFDASVSEIFVTFLAGAILCVFPQDTLLPGLTLSRTLREQAITVVTLPPSALAIMNEEEFPDLKTIVSAGEPCSAEIVARWASGRRFLNAYGPSEATVCATINEHVQIGNPPSIGVAIANTQIYIVDSYMQPLPVGVPGELYIGGVGLARGYLNRPGLTTSTFIPNPFSNKPGARLYKTGDLARYLPDGNIEFLGRIDHQVKIRGFRIEPGEIETVLANHSTVREAVVVAREDATGNKRLIAYIVPHQDQAATASELCAFLKQQLPDYMIPATFMFLDALPLTPNGKVDRRALPDSDIARPELDEIFVAPRNPTEKVLADIWAEILQVERVGMNDNFFELGGHSLLAVRLIAQIQQQFEKKLPVAVLFQAPTIAQLARFISQQAPSGPFTPLVSMQPHGDNPPFFVVHPGDGNIFCYAELVRQIGIKRPVYGLQAFGLDPATSPLNRFEDMAARYIESLRSVYPKGPYALGGFCLGGTIALEMARQLRDSGERVQLVALFDSVAPHAYCPFEDNTLRYMSFGHDFGGLNDTDLLLFYLEIRKIDPKEGIEGIHKDLQSLSHREKLHILCECAQKAGKDIHLEYLERVFNVYAAIGDAVLEYRARAYNGRIALFRTVNFSSPLTDDPVLGWGEYTSSLEVYNIPGDHFAMLRQPHVNVLAEQLNACLEKPH